MTLLSCRYFERTHTYTHTHTHTHIHTCTHTCTHTYTYTHIHTCINMYRSIHIYMSKGIKFRDKYTELRWPHTATCCNALQHIPIYTATHCQKVLEEVINALSWGGNTLLHALQHTATHTATHYDILQHAIKRSHGRWQMNTYKYVQINIYKYIYVHMYECVHKSLCVCACVCVEVARVKVRG